MEDLRTRRTLHYTEIPIPQPGDLFWQEMSTYYREVKRLLEEGLEGKWVLLSGTELCGVFDTLEAVVKAGYRQFEPGKFCIHEIREYEPLLHLRLFA